MKIKKIINTAKTWYELKTPVEIKTPNGSQTISRFYFNGFDDHLDVTFNNAAGEVFGIQCTPNHPFRLLDETWVNAEDFEIGDELNNGWFFAGASIGKCIVPTMDMEVPKEHCYILENGIISHNTALIMGGVSEGINPDPAMTFTQLTSAGEVDRANPILLEVMKKKGVYDKKHWQELVDSQGSVQEVDWLSNEEKAVFKTAFEINQEVILRMASQRQRFIDQGQSINLFFSANESEAHIAKIHQLAFMDENIHALYYTYSKSGVTGSKGECESCQ